LVAKQPDVAFNTDNIAFHRSSAVPGCLTLLRDFCLEDWTSSKYCSFFFILFL